MNADVAALLAWYRRNRRELPWRATRDPYAVLVSEFMLQQTRVETAVPYYLRFLQRFPTVADLARAPLEDVLAVWQGLGYYRRARHLHAAARRIIDGHAGRVPDDVDVLRSLPGVGPYTAAAVASIAFDRPAAALDGNMMRVLARFLGEDRPVDLADARRNLAAAAQGLVERGPPGEVNQALMELGALVCTPRSPDCAGCPLAAACRARQQGRQGQIPVTRPGRAASTLALTAGLAAGSGRVLLRRRPDGGLLAGLWEFPWVEGHGDEACRRLLCLLEAVGVRAQPGACLERRTWRFSHLTWDVVLWRLVPEPQPHARVDAVAERTASLQWVPLKDAPGHAMPALFRSWLAQYGGNEE